MLEHQPAAVDRLMILAPAPVYVELLVLVATAAMLDVEVIVLVVRLDGTTTAATPDDSQVSTVKVGIDGHRLTAPPSNNPFYLNELNTWKPTPAGVGPTHHGR